MTLKPYLLCYKSLYYTGLVWLLNEPDVMREGFSTVLVNAAVAKQFDRLHERRRFQWVAVSDFKPTLI